MHGIMQILQLRVMAPLKRLIGAVAKKKRADDSATVTSAEGGVDIFVRDNLFKNVSKGVFVEVGAAQPDFLSISMLFRSMGWRIIAVEPNPAFCELHRKKGYEILEYACGERDADNVNFTVVDSHNVAYEKGNVTYESFSSLEIKDEYRKLYESTKINFDSKTIKVKLRRLDTILATHAAEIDHIDILSVDTEGWEIEVVKGLNLDKYKPKVMVIENLFNSEEYRSFMDKRGYILWRQIPPNDIYIRK